MARTNWREIADLLAGRLMHNAACPTHASQDVDGCPFCADHTAVRAYLAAGGTVRPYEHGGPTISLAELAAAALTEDTP